MKENIKRFDYSNATKYKIKNKRVVVEDIENGFGITLVSLNKKDVTTPHLFTNIQRGVRTTNFALSKHATVALYFALQARITLDDITDYVSICTSPILDI